MQREDRVRQLVDDFQNGHLTRRGFLAKAGAVGLTAAAAVGLLGAPRTQRPAVAQSAVQPKQWEQGTGWGWVWGDDDQLGNLNELSPELTLKALSRVEEGKVYDLGLMYDRYSFRFDGHNPGEVISFRTPDGLNTQQDQDFVNSEEDNSLNSAWSSNALFISDNVATQIDSFGHFYEGSPPHTYNDFRSEEIQGDFGLLKLGADTIPPIVAPATMIDVAKSVGEDPLPEGFGIGPDRLQAALDDQGVDIDPLDIVLVRTGTGGVWLEGDGVGANVDELGKVDTAGLTLSGARWLVEEKGSSRRRRGHLGHRAASRRASSSTRDPASIPSTSTSWCGRACTSLSYHNQEQLAEDEVYKFAYVLGVNKIKGAAAGTALKPIGIA